MFKRNKTPQKKEFNYTVDHIFEDIESIKHDVNQKNKLYLCLDDKIPVIEKPFANVQNFLKGSDNLEDAVNSVDELLKKLENLEKDMLECEKTITELVQNK